MNASTNQSITLSCVQDEGRNSLSQFILKWYCFSASHRLLGVCNYLHLFIIHQTNHSYAGRNTLPLKTNVPVLSSLTKIKNGRSAINSKSLSRLLLSIVLISVDANAVFPLSLISIVVFCIKFDTFGYSSWADTACPKLAKDARLVKISTIPIWYSIKCR